MHLTGFMPAMKGKRNLWYIFLEYMSDYKTVFVYLRIVSDRWAFLSCDLFINYL